jgi:hypothetical protein
MTEITAQEHTLFDFELTEAMYEKYWKFSYGKGVNYKFNQRAWIVFWVIFGLSLLVFNLVYYGMAYGNHLDILDAFDWISALIPLVFAVYYLIKYFYGGRRTYRKTPLMHAHYTFDFDQDGINVTSASAFATGQSQLQYAMLKKVYETQDAFYVLITNRTGYVVDKSGLIQGNLTALRIHLKHVLNKKYILCK